MTEQGRPGEAAIEITVGNALRHADAADDVVLRVLSGLRAAGDHQFTPVPPQTSLDWPLPRRMPGTNPGPYSPWAAQPPVPAVREASAIAQNTSNYLRGWRLGNEAIRAARPVAVAAVATSVQSPTAPPGQPATTAHGRVRRRIGVRPGTTAIRLVGFVVQVLPERERPRYHEEFRAELSRLGGRHQIGYALRLLLSMFALRRALRQPADDVEAE